MDMLKVGLSAGVGIVDELLQAWDEKEGRVKTFQNAKDIARTLEVVSGIILQVAKPRATQMRIGEALALSAIPLLVKSIAVPIREKVASPVATRTAHPLALGRASAPAASRMGANIMEEEKLELI